MTVGYVRGDASASSDVAVANVLSAATPERDVAHTAGLNMIV